MAMKVKHLAAMIAFILLLTVGFLVLSSTIGSSVHPELLVDAEGAIRSETCWVPKGRETCAPHFIIPGSMKCGTTSMFAYLLKHPDVLELRSTEIDPKGSRTVMAEKEVRFFNDPAWKGLVKQFGEKRAVSHYLDLFEEIPPPTAPQHPDPEVEKNRGKITGESSPMYVCQPGVAARIHNHLPEVRIILMLRDPVDRAYSEFWFRQSLKTRSPSDQQRMMVDELEKMTLMFTQCFMSDYALAQHCKADEWLERPTVVGAYNFHACYRNISKTMKSVNAAVDDRCKANSPLQPACLDKATSTYCSSHPAVNGMYAFQILEYLDLFPKANVKVIKSEDFYENPASVMTDVQEFLGLADFDWEQATQKVYNIINPRALAAEKFEVATSDTKSNKGLQMGSSSSPSDYPPLDPGVRMRLQGVMRVYNKAVARMLDTTALWPPELREAL